MVYFVQAADQRGAIKIGYSTDPIRRLRDLKPCSPVPLRLIATAPGEVADERLIHQQFAWCRSHYEWFHPEPQLLRFMTEARWAERRFDI